MLMKKSRGNVSEKGHGIRPKNAGGVSQKMPGGVSKKMPGGISQKSRGGDSPENILEKMPYRKTRGALDRTLKKYKEKDKEIFQWAKAMLETKEALDVVPKGWYSQKQLAKKFGYIPSGIGPHVRRLVREGKAEQKKFKTTRGKDGRRMSVTHYRLL